MHLTYKIDGCRREKIEWRPGEPDSRKSSRCETQYVGEKEVQNYEDDIPAEK